MPAGQYAQPDTLAKNIPGGQKYFQWQSMRSSNIVKATSVSGDTGVEVAFNGVQVTYLDVLPAMYVLPHEPVHCPYFGIELLQVRHDESDVRSPQYPFWSQQQFKTANYQHHQKGYDSVITACSV